MHCPLMHVVSWSQTPWQVQQLLLDVQAGL
jgi:hypothetical protein